MARIQVGPGQWEITSAGIYEHYVDEANFSGSVPALRLLPDVPYITVILRGRNEGGPSASQNIGISGLRNNALRIIGQGFSIRGYRDAVRLVDCQLAQVESIYVQDAFLNGIGVSGDDPVVANNTILKVGGWTISPERAFGINVSGLRPVIRGNTVLEVTSPYEEAVGVSVNDRGERGSIFGNIIKCTQAAPYLPSTLPGSWGVWCGGSVAPAPTTDVEVTHNQISGWTVGIGTTSPTEALVDENTLRNCTELMRTSSHHVIGGIDG